jgi:hypothetical protein
MGSKQQMPLSHHPYPHPPLPPSCPPFIRPPPPSHTGSGCQPQAVTSPPPRLPSFPLHKLHNTRTMTNVTTCQCHMPVVPKLISWAGLHCYSLDIFVDSYRIWPNIFVFMTSTTKVLTVLFCSTLLGNYARSTRLCKQSLPIMAKICGSGLVQVWTWKLP